jgi:hypothetical protein
MGGKYQKWTKELDNKLLEEIAKGRNIVQLEIVMKMSRFTFMKRLKEMGFKNLVDARNVMSD